VARADRSRRAGRWSGRRAGWRSTSTATKERPGWNLERLNELELYLVETSGHTGYRTVFGGRPLPLPRELRARSANPIGLRDLVVIEGLEFCRSAGRGPAAHAGFAEALDWVAVQAALLESAESGR
jgi:hypothetical protein